LKLTMYPPKMKPLGRIVNKIKSAALSRILIE